MLCGSNKKMGMNVRSVHIAGPGPSRADAQGSSNKAMIGKRNLFHATSIRGLMAGIVDFLNFASAEMALNCPDRSRQGLVNGSFSLFGYTLDGDDARAEAA
jgi:hypothetical protein